jgi:hypothetical protein
MVSPAEESHHRQQENYVTRCWPHTGGRDTSALATSRLEVTPRGSTPSGETTTRCEQSCSPMIYAARPDVSSGLIVTIWLAVTSPASASRGPEAAARARSRCSS